MLVRNLDDYQKAHYPVLDYTYYDQLIAKLLLHHGLLPASVASLLSTVFCGGLTSPEMLDEQKARTIIEKVFNDNSVTFEADVPFTIQTSDTSTCEFQLDGYNQQLKIGYEFFEYSDDPACEQCRLKPDKLEQAMEGYDLQILPIENMDINNNPYYEQQLELKVKAFIDQLKVQGIL
jgi:hypothetical protein